MLSKKPLILAMAAAGLCFSTVAVAGGSPPFNTLCGNTITEDTTVACGAVELQAYCLIGVDAGFNLNVPCSTIDADGFTLRIVGDEFATLDWNAPISDANKIVFNFFGSTADGGIGVEEPSPCDEFDIIDIIDPDFEAFGTGGADGRFVAITSCGNIDMTVESGCNGYGIDSYGEIRIGTNAGDVNLVDAAMCAEADARESDNTGGLIFIYAGGHPQYNLQSHGWEYRAESTFFVAPGGTSPYVGPGDLP